MPDKPGPSPDSVRLNEEAARRLLQRATELDASLSTQSSVAELREAARDAGISEEAFQRALEEVRAEAAAAHPSAQRARQSTRRVYVMVAAIVLLAAAVIASRLAPRRGGVTARPEITAPVEPLPAPTAVPVTPVPPPSAAPAAPARPAARPPR